MYDRSVCTAYEEVAMKRWNGAGIWLAVAMLVSAKAAQAQASVYVEGSAYYLNNGPYTDFLEGGKAGVLFDLAQVWHDRITLSADLQGDIGYNGTEPAGGNYNSPGEYYDALTVGPRVSLKPLFYKLAPYAHLNIGFARYGDPINHSSTDTVIGGQAGVTRRLTSRLDGVLDYGYSYFGYNFGYYNPQSFSAGVVVHFTKR
jgi:hypothetical protein